MEVKIPCNEYHCLEDCEVHAYCDRHFQEKLDEKYEEGYEVAKKEFSNE